MVIEEGIEVEDGEACNACVVDSNESEGTWLITCAAAACRHWRSVEVHHPISAKNSRQSCTCLIWPSSHTLSLFYLIWCLCIPTPIRSSLALLYLAIYIFCFFFLIYLFKMVIDIMSSSSKNIKTIRNN